MGNNKRAKVLCYAVVTAMTLTSVVGPGNVSAAKKAKTAKKTLTITQGESQNIVIKNKKSKAAYLFKASNAKIKVTKKGKVTAVKVGKAKVTVTEKYKKKKRKIGVVTVKVKAKKAVTPTGNPNAGTTELSANAATAVPNVTPDTVPAGSAATRSASSSPAPAKTPDDTEKTVVYNNYFEDGDTKGITGRGSSVEISQSENHTEGGMNSLLCTGRSASWHGAERLFLLAN